MPFAAFIPLIAAAIQAGSQALSNRSQKKQNERSIQANKELAEYQYSKEKEQIDAQNQYNSPYMQMQRLQQGQLNPNLVYGGGVGGTTGQQSQIARYNAPTVQYNYTPLLQNLPEMLNAYQDFSMRQAQVDNVRANTANIDARTLTESMRPQLLEQDYKQKDYTNPYQAAIMGGKARESEAKVQQEWQKLSLMKQQDLQNILDARIKQKQLTSMDIENERKQTEILFNKYRNQWMKMGITTSDHPLMRIITRQMAESGLNPMQAIEKMKNYKSPASPYQ